MSRKSMTSRKSQTSLKLGNQKFEKVGQFHVKNNMLLEDTIKNKLVAHVGEVHENFAK